MLQNFNYHFYNVADAECNVHVIFNRINRKRSAVIYRETRTVHNHNLIIVDGQNSNNIVHVCDPRLFVICNKFTPFNLERAERALIFRRVPLLYSPTFPIILNSLRNN